MSVANGPSARTLRVSGNAIPVVLGRPALEPVRLCGHEGLKSLFEYELLLKTPDSLNLSVSGAADFDCTPTGRRRFASPEKKYGKPLWFSLVQFRDGRICAVGAG